VPQVISRPSDAQHHYIAGLDQLEAARKVIDAVLDGTWHGDRVLMKNLADLVHVAGEHFHRSELCGGRAAA
jgi:hypothetical protein